MFRRMIAFCKDNCASNASPYFLRWDKGLDWREHWHFSSFLFILEYTVMPLKQDMQDLISAVPSLPIDIPRIKEGILVHPSIPFWFTRIIFLVAGKSSGSFDRRRAHAMWTPLNVHAEAEPAFHREEIPLSAIRTPFLHVSSIWCDTGSKYHLMKVIEPLGAFLGRFVRNIGY
jgi:hypothetical protein